MRCGGSADIYGTADVGGGGIGTEGIGVTFPITGVGGGGATMAGGHGGGLGVTGLGGGLIGVGDGVTGAGVGVTRFPGAGAGGLFGLWRPSRTTA